MKKSLSRSVVWYHRFTRFLVAILTVVLMATSVAMSVEVVNLGSTESFVILGQSAITGTTNSAITGNVGLSPEVGSYISGLLQANVNGTIYAVDATGPTGSVVDATFLTAVMDDFSTAYTDAAGRSADVTNTGTTVDIGGMSLDPGVYKFTDAASISVSDLTLSGNSTDVWIFQIGSTLTMDADRQVILLGGALASNIFWQVGSAATINASCVFKGTILASTAITFGANVTIEGRAFAGSAVTLGDNVTFTAPATIPVVSTAAISNILSNTADGGGNVTDDGGATITARGICWSTSANPVATGNHTTESGTTGTFSSSLTGLSVNTLYHVRAYATNTNGTNYGDDVTFSTIPILPVWGLITLGSIILLVGGFYIRRMFV